jgi:hypothetical protein
VVPGAIDAGLQVTATCVTVDAGGVVTVLTFEFPHPHTNNVTGSHALPIKFRTLCRTFFIAFQELPRIQILIR